MSDCYRRSFVALTERVNYMKNIKTAGIALLVAVSVGACSTSVASAAGLEFVYSKAGTITGHQLHAQTFRLGTDITCTEATTSGELKSGEYRRHELLLSVAYAKCHTSFATATVSTARYDWLLPPAVRLENAITIHSSALGAYCTFVISGGQSLGANAGEVEYENKSGKLVVKNDLSDISYEVTESNVPKLCGSAGEKFTSGTFTGELEVELEGGTMGVATE